MKKISKEQFFFFFFVTLHSKEAHKRILWALFSVVGPQNCEFKEKPQSFSRNRTIVKRVRNHHQLREISLKSLDKSFFIKKRKKQKMFISFFRHFEKRHSFSFSSKNEKAPFCFLLLFVFSFSFYDFRKQK